jgi:transposase-like protein
MLFAKLVSGSDCGLGSTHPLAFAGQLYHRVILNQEQVSRVARQLGLCPEVCRGIVRLLKAHGKVPSRERLAVICQLDQGYDDSDVGEVFGMSAEWSASVRLHAAEIREAEQIEARLEWYDEGLKPFDPSPAEILQRALEVRSNRGMERKPTPGIRSFAWRPRGASFIQIRVD